jgi:hypothetical protein
VTAENRNLNELIESVWQNIKGGNYNDDEKKQKREQERENGNFRMTRQCFKVAYETRCRNMPENPFLIILPGWLAGWLLTSLSLLAAFAKESELITK